MPFLNQETGELSFSDGLCLQAFMPAHEISPPHAAGQQKMICLPPHALRGGSISAVCLIDADALCAITLYAATVGEKERVGTDRQRAYLFSALHLKDPCPDTRRSVKVRFPFGEVLLATDPYTGQARARFVFAARGR